MTNTNRPPGSDADNLADQRQRLDYVEQQLMEYRIDIPNEDLRAHVTGWLHRARDAAAGSAREHVTQELADIQTGNAMYRRPGARDPGSEFPDRCAGDDPENPQCPHYGIACPIVTDNTVKRELNRILDETDDPSRLRERLRTLAIENSCHVITDALHDITTEYEPLIREGQTYLEATEDLIHGTDGEAAVKRALAAEHVQSPSDYEVYYVENEARAADGADSAVTPSETADAPQATDDEPARTDGGPGR